MLQIVASLIDAARGVIYDHHMFIVQATGQRQNWFQSKFQILFFIIFQNLFSYHRYHLSWHPGGIWHNIFMVILRFYLWGTGIEIVPEQAPFDVFVSFFSSFEHAKKPADYGPHFWFWHETKKQFLDKIWCFFTIKARFWQFYSCLIWEN